MINLIVSILLFLISIFTLFYVITRLATPKKELKIAKFVSEFSWIEAEYWTMINKNQFHAYPNIENYLSRVSGINTLISENFSGWHKKIRIVPVILVVSKPNVELRTELKTCTDKDVKDLLIRKNKLLKSVYAMQHPIRYFLYSVLMSVFTLIVFAYILIKELIAVFENAKKVKVTEYLSYGIVNPVKDKLNYINPNSFQVKQA